MAKNKKISFAALALILLMSTVCRISFISGSLPYSRHVDELAIIPNATRILKTGDLDPGIYVYPSLPIYLTTLSMGIGYLNERVNSRISGLDQLHGRVYPYFDHPGVIFPPKVLFALFSILVLLIVALLAYKVTGSYVTLVITPLILSCSSLFMYHSWVYINLDIAASLAVSGILLFFVYSWKKKSWYYKAFIPGILCGITVACKYPHGLVVIPFLISIFVNCRKRFLRLSGVLFSALFATFVFFMPYSMIRFGHFLERLNVQRKIYSNGHFGFTVKPGIPHLIIQIQQLVQEYGLLLCLLCLIGVTWVIRKHKKMGWALISYPIIYLLYFCSYSANIVRTLLPVYVLFAVFAAIGVVGTIEYIVAYLKETRAFINRQRLLKPCVAFILILAFAITAPWDKIISSYSVKEDSRNTVVHWFKDNVEKGSEIIIASELNMNIEQLQKDYQIEQVPFNTKEIHPTLLKKGESKNTYFLVPDFGFDDRWPKRAALANELNSRFEESTIVRRFGGEYGVLVLYPFPIAWGDPRFSVHKGLLVRK